MPSSTPPPNNADNAILRVAGVLVFVEQDDAVALPQPPADLWQLAASRAAAAIWLPKSIALAARIRACRASISGTSAARSVWVSSMSSSRRFGPPLAQATRQGVHEPLEFDVGVGSSSGVDEVFGQFVGEPAPSPSRRPGLADRQRIGMCMDDLEGELPPLGLAEQPSVGLTGSSGPNSASSVPAKAWYVLTVGDRAAPKPRCPESRASRERTSRSKLPGRPSG